MGAKTGISWTDATWNPIRGCSRVSEGCRHCYAETVAHRFSGPGLAYEGLVQLDAAGKSTGKWNGNIKFVEGHLLDPLRWKKPRRIFVNSMSDLFHENVIDEMCDKIFAVMALCPQHAFQVLTKRPERMLAYLSNPALPGRLAAVIAHMGHGYKGPAKQMAALKNRVRRDLLPLPHVHLGVSVENQKAADERIPLLLQTPAAVRFISVEPLLGSVDLFKVRRPHGTYIQEFSSRNTALGDLNWVIVGGESGAGARPMHPDWARSLRGQCKAAGVPFFFKQWGMWMHGSDFRDSARIVLNDGRVIADPDELNQADRNRWSDFRSEMMAPVGAKAAGCLLDGVEHHEFPAVQG